MALVKTNEASVLIQPLDGFKGSTVGNAHTMHFKTCALNPDANYDAQKEVYPGGRRVAGRKLTKDGGAWEITGLARAPRKGNVYGFLLEMALGANEADATFIEVANFAGTESGGNQIASIPDNTFVGTNKPIAVGDIIGLREYAAGDTNNWKITRILTFTDSTTETITFTPSIAPVGASNFDIRMNRWKMNTKDRYADIYIKRASNEGEVCRSCQVDTLSYNFSAQEVTFNVSGKAERWEAVTSFPTADAAETTSAFSFKETDAGILAPSGMNFSKDLTLTIKTGAQQFEAQNLRYPVDSQIGEPEVNIDLGMFIDDGTDYKATALAETTDTLRLFVQNEKDIFGFACTGKWENITSRHEGPHVIVEADGQFMVIQDGTNDLEVFGMDNTAIT